MPFSAELESLCAANPLHPTGTCQNVKHLYNILLSNFHLSSYWTQPGGEASLLADSDSKYAGHLNQRNNHCTDPCILPHTAINHQPFPEKVLNKTKLPQVPPLQPNSLDPFGVQQLTQHAQGPSTLLRQSDDIHIHYQTTTNSLPFPVSNYNMSA